MHASNGALLSSGRAVILADAGAHRLRLWQLVRVEATLRERLDTALGEPDPRSAASGVLDVAASLLRAAELFSRATVHLPCTLWTVSTGHSTAPCFVGLMPTSELNGGELAATDALLGRELTPHLRALRRNRVDYHEVLREVASCARSSALGAALGPLLDVNLAAD